MRLVPCSAGDRTGPCQISSTEFKEPHPYVKCVPPQLMNKGKRTTEHWIECTKFSDLRKAQNPSFQLEKINSLEMLCLEARS